MLRRPIQIVVLLIGLLISSVCTAQQPPTYSAEQIEFFETKIRPLLATRCYQCHSGKSKSLKAGLRLDNREAIHTGGDSGTSVVNGKPDESLLIQSVRYESYEMPPDGKLNDSEIAALVHWVKTGTPWPEESTIPPTTTGEPGYDWSTVHKQHWAWQPVRRVEPPSADNDSTERINNPIDNFVVAELREKQLSQTRPATARVFVRRVFLDLVGLPPTLQQLNEWVARLETDRAGDALNDTAVSDLIDSLLDTRQYGERWGRHWLDVARYSDGGGWTQDNKPRPNAWRYRDWVVEAFNIDMPYNEFVRQQIAGDMIDKHAAIGTGFFALGPAYSSDGGDPESIAQAKSETLDDRVDTFSRAFLGLTVACARCHDHKFDPIPTQDYYSLAGIFDNSREHDLPLSDDNVVRNYHEHQQQTGDRKNKINKIRQDAKQAKRELSDDEKTQLGAWQTELNILNAHAPPKYDSAHTIHDTGSADMHVALRGNLLKPGGFAPRRFLRIVAGADREHFAEGSGRRQLAAAVVDPSNPLTARVMVNRIWLNHFGRALVRSPGNFGTLGEKPTHPRLLDWLATTLIESGWSIKSMHRLIMTSATYRSSSSFDETAFDRDSDNRSVWRMNPRRMEVETWRDSLLAVTGELDLAIGGPAIDNITGSNRRTLYAKVSRNNPFASDEFLRLFDFPIPRASSAKRTTNVLPQQFLFMMNSQFMVDRAKALVQQLQQESGSLNSQIERAYGLLYGRKPTQQELQVATGFLQSESSAGTVLTRWEQYCQVLLSANEFMYIR
jgi:cytochrome c553